MAFKPKDTNERILHRLKIAQGHLEKVLKMTKSHAYCIDVLHQSNAVQRALKEVDNLILENHLKTCAADAIKSGKQKEAIKELMNVLRNGRR